MSAEVLRRAATDLRGDFPACTHDQSKRPRPCEEDLPLYHQDAAAFNAVADWLDSVAERLEVRTDGRILGATDVDCALAVARAYLDQP